MRAFLDFLTDSLLQALGRPSAVQRVVRQAGVPLGDLGDAPRSIDLRSSVASWHTWHEPHQLGLQVFQPDLHELARNLVRVEVAGDFTCDLRDVDGLAASRSDLASYATLRDFALDRCRPWCDDRRPDAVQENLQHGEIRITKPASFPSDYFETHAWDGRLFLNNAGGSHHFATAWHIAHEIDLGVPLKGRIYRYSLRPDAVATLVGHKHLIVVPTALLDDSRWFDAMDSFDAPFDQILPPQPYSGRVVLVLPRDNRRSNAVADALRHAGAEDLGRRLRMLANMRHRW